MDRVIQIAKNEVGYLEKKSNADLDDKVRNAGQQNYTKYWRDLCPSLQGNAWCGCFVNWCFQKAYRANMALQLLCCTKAYSYYTPTMVSYFKSKKQFYTSKPQKGDIIFFRNSSRICHVALVRDVDSTYVYTIEGNTSSAPGVVANGGCVAMKKYALNNPRIAGYGRPNYALVNDGNPYPKPIGSLKKGDKNEYVKWLQYELNEVGYKLDPDGDFGSLTEAALVDFQKKKGLEPDGVCGKATKEKLIMN